jgi:iron complex transport system ATP-binding protein
MPIVLEVSQLRVKRGQTTILRDISWRVDQGQHWVILGPNGCGKTSLLKSLTGFLSPTAGEITVLGRRYGRSDWRELRMHVGIVSSALQTSIPAAEPALETVVSGRYAQLDLWAKPTVSDVREAKKHLALVGISPLAAREWAFLSQGEKQRVLIARALIARPKLLILDEPCAGLDPVAREKFLALIQRLARRKRSPALVLVTHHVEEIAPAFTHALVLRRGSIHAQGVKERVVTSAVLSGAFGAPLNVRRKKSRFQLA